MTNRKTRSREGERSARRSGAVAGVGGCRALELVALFLGLLHPCGYLHPVVPGALWIVRAQSDALHEPLGSFERVSVHLILWYAPMGAVQGKRGALEAVTLPFQLVPPVNDLAEMATMARLWPSSAAWLFFVMVMMVGSGPPFAQRHDRSGLAWLREEVSQLFSEGNYTEAIPVAERYFAIARQRYGQSHPEFRA